MMIGEFGASWYGRGPGLKEGIRKAGSRCSGREKLPTSLYAACLRALAAYGEIPCKKKEDIKRLEQTQIPLDIKSSILTYFIKAVRAMASNQMLETNMRLNMNWGFS